ncbi:MAG: LLM class F420-dependent oxidoreductase, partial [Acidimicrobiaceae bacterium]|nr:LLM class F420-dependent oxidoreductase [Acidimicrobiaceae bacterium]
PALLAQSAASLASAAPGRFVLGIGSSSDVIVGRWNAAAFDRPYQRVRDTIRFLRAAMSGEKVTEDYDTFSVRGFRLGVRVDEPVPIFVAALRERMLRLAAREGDGAIINWLSAQDAGRVCAIVRSESPAAEIVARIFVLPTSDREAAMATGRFILAAYLNVPVYRAFHSWLGRTDALGEHWAQWQAGDRRGSLAKIPEQVVDELLVHGTPEECRDHIRRFVDNGVTCPAPIVLPVEGVDALEVVRALAPAGR